MLSYRDRQDRNAQEKDRRFHAGLPTGAGAGAGVAAEEAQREKRGVQVSELLRTKGKGLRHTRPS